jgi:ribosomal protein S27E
VRYQYHFSDKCTISGEVQGPKELVRELASIGELFIETTCKLCNNTNVSFEHRLHDGHSFYSIRCPKCGGRADFGQHKTGETLFLKRREDGKYWYRWQAGDRQNGNQDQQNASQLSGPAPARTPPKDYRDEDVPF